MRRAVIDRRTTETSIAMKIDLDGKGKYQVRTGIRFLDHMLELFARHGAFNLTIDAKGDLDVDQHHTVEDLGIALGEAVSAALGTRRGINRAGYFVMPMDETLAVAAIDLSGRPHAVVDLKVKTARVGDLQTELVHDFFEGFAIGARANVHVKVLYGRSSHHHVEAVFKAFARALRVACSKDKRLGESAPEHQGPVVIALIDYRAGNLTSVRKAFAALGADLYTPASPAELGEAAAIVVPGVGHFGATRALGPDWMEAILARVGEGRPLLGICLGMQWLFEGSEEAPELPGLGLLGGQCYRLPATADHQDSPRGLERARDAAGRVDRRRRGAQVRRCTSRTASWRPSRATRWPSPGTANRLRPSCSADTSPASSFIPRNRATWGCRSFGIS